MSDLMLLVLSGGLLTVVIGGVSYWRTADQARRDHERLRYRLRFAPGLTPEGVLAFVRSLVTLRPGGSLVTGTDSAVFEVIATSSGIEHRLRLPRRHAAAVLAQLRAAIPSAAVEELSPDTVSCLTVAEELRLSVPSRSLRTDQPAATAAALLAAFQPLARDETLLLQLVVRPSAHQLAPPASPSTKPPSVGPFDLSALLRPKEPHQASLGVWREKTAEPLFAASLRLGASCPHRGRAWSLVRRLRAVLHVVQRPGATLLRRRLGDARVVAAVERATTRAASPLLVNAAELAVLLGWPVGTPVVPGLNLQRSRRLAPVDGIATSGRVLGQASTSSASRQVALSAADSLHHVHALGPTGVGKSTLLANLICQDIQAGRGVVLIDPKGDLVASVLDRIPSQRTDDVILLDPADTERPVGLNLLAGAQAAPDLVADQCLGIFHRLYAAFWGPRTADILHASLLTVAQAPGATLCELPLLLTSEAYRRCLVGKLDDPVALGPFWAWYEQLSPGERAAAIGPVMNKLRAFLLRRQLRNVIGQRQPTWTMEEVLNRRRILLVSLARGQLGGETAALVGSLVVARLWQAIQRRTVRPPAMVVIDEFQDTVGGVTDLGELLAQARGFGVGVTLAHQHLGQLDTRTRAAVLANARTKVVFQAAADDASVLAKQLGGSLGGSDLMNLGRHEAYAAVCVQGEVLPPASLRTLPLPASLGSAQVVQAASRERYGRDRGAVEAAITARHGSSDSAHEPLGSRRRAS